eukprot:scaffold131975_cov17-Tisochrysis_lutea.AAC.1
MSHEDGAYSSSSKSYSSALVLRGRHWDADEAHGCPSAKHCTLPGSGTHRLLPLAALQKISLCPL